MMTMKQITIKIKQYKLDNKTRYLATVDMGAYLHSCNASSMKALLNDIKRLLL